MLRGIACLDLRSGSVWPVADCLAMDAELRELREKVRQLQADKDILVEQAEARSSPSASTASTASCNAARDILPTERLLYHVPRERKCPPFRGTSGIPVEDWAEEVRATIRARHLRPLDQAYFIYDHLEGEAKDEIRYRPRADREDPDRILQILQDLYGCAKPYVSLQQSFFSRKQLEGESLQEFSHALCCLMEKIERVAPEEMTNAATLLRDQFIEHVWDPDLRRELKRVVRQHPDFTLLQIRAEAIRWEREGRPDEPRSRSYSLPALCATQRMGTGPDSTGCAEMAEIKNMLKQQQEQLNTLTQSLLTLQSAPKPSPPLNRRFQPNFSGPVICRRCQKPGHYARECDNARVIPASQQPKGYHQSRAAASSASHQAEN